MVCTSAHLSAQTRALLTAMQRAGGNGNGGYAEAIAAAGVGAAGDDLTSGRRCAAPDQ
jgi:hypothetical protein